MSTIAKKLTTLNSMKTDIKSAIEEKGVAVSDSTTFRTYADSIRVISTIETVPDGKNTDIVYCTSDEQYYLWR